ncbi:uncharacterized protein Dwil_GK20683 [Drosophila willistoni]|uniref:Ionotropic glutamate receptor C-terminal domain-containing protein n=1 Tax=Drosophila willistoni TaxID=7260 RepID=B4MK45_DROWI|nr:uncharacterized protein Dwil_GK20683 [Drosophila willistoni]
MRSNIWFYYSFFGVSAALVLAQLQPLQSSDEDNQFVLHVINCFDDHGRHRNFITFAGDEGLPSSNNVVSKSLQSSLMEKFQRPVIVAGQKIGEFKNWITLNNFVIVIFSSLIDDPMLKAYNSTVQNDGVNGESQLQLGGVLGILLVEFARFINATLEIYHLPDKDNFKENFKRVAGDRNVAISPNLIEDNGLCQISPLVVVSRVCLAVPNRRPMPKYTYLGTICKSSFRMFILFCILVHFFIKRLTNPRQPLSTSVESSLQLSIGLPRTHRVFQRLTAPEKHVETSFYLFLFTSLNIASSFLTMHLISGYYKPTITDVETMKASGLRILYTDTAVRELFEHDSLPIELMPQLLLVNSSTMDHLLNTLDMNYAYLIEEHHFEKLTYIQRHLEYPKLKIAHNDLCSAPRFLRCAINMGSPLSRALFAFNHQVRSNGLFIKFIKSGTQMGAEQGYYKHAPVEVTTLDPLNLQFFSILFYFYITFMIIGIIVFITEMLVHRYR